MDSTNETARVPKVTSRADVGSGANLRAMPRAVRCFIVAVAGLVSIVGPTPASWGAVRQASSASTPTTYVTNSQSDTVTVVSGTAIVGTIEVANGPVGIALTPDRSMAYVANYGFYNEPSHTVTPLILGTRKAGRPIRVGIGPMAIAVDSQVAVVTLEGTLAQPGHQVVVIDLANRKVSAPIEVGLNPESLAISRDGKTAYVASFGSGEVTPVNLATSPPQAESPIPLPGTSPRAIAISKNGTTAYVLDAANSTVIPISLASRSVGEAVPLHCSEMGDPGCIPTAITISQNGKDAYIAAAGSADVLELSIPSLDVVRVLPTGGYPDALGFEPGWLFVADGASDNLTVVHHGTQSVSPFSYPFGVAVVSGAASDPGRADGPTNPTALGSSHAPVGARIIPTGRPLQFYGVQFV
jgi:DNA-binding beta-propeller fold protein YncE